MRFYFIFVILFAFSSLSQAAAPPNIQLASIYKDDIDIQQYWISEKLDGVRGYWNGTNLISRQGNIFNAPKWFTQHFPDIPLDGELWIGREQFELVSGIVRQFNASEQDWQKITFMIFDMPASKDTFSERIRQMKNIVNQTDSPYLQMIPQQKVTNNSQLQALLETILKEGGEGLMLHRGEAYYQAKRSKDLMKLKKYQDAEAIVLAHLPGKGRNAARLGALRVKTTDGIIFKIGTGFSDHERENPPAIGSTITYQYIGKTKNNVPRFASFMRIREEN
ncbi:DNA ligase [Psychromonas sp. PT13]|uniref:DNA ligase n=1 Tax=Psychromonas sp. PT13 TaxID=3439547 RepID=UPI003EBA7035